MNRLEIVTRVNQLMYEGLYDYEQIKYELDDAIRNINITLSSNFPNMTDSLIDDTSIYTYTGYQKDEDGNYVYAEDGITRLTELKTFPDRYIHSVVIPYVVQMLFRREGEFGNEYMVAKRDYEDGLAIMFRDYFDKVDEYIQDTESGMIEMNPDIVEEDTSMLLDPLDQGSD